MTYFDVIFAAWIGKAAAANKQRVRKSCMVKLILGYERCLVSLKMRAF